ncbi:MAG: MFS transporter [Chloroflexi bacterium]|nr:MFS transporter [Chloroflexota bacterium]
MSLPSISDLPAAQRRIIRAWCMYDWANSAWATSVAAILPIYFVHLFEDSLGESEVFLGITFTGSSMWSLGVAISTGIVAFSSPVIGVIADRAPIRKALLWAYTTIGAFFTVLAFFSAFSPEPWLWLFGVFTIANIGFAGGLVFYNSFLPHLGPRHLLDEISSRGFAYGYAGGGLILVVHLVLILAADGTDFEDVVVRFAIASVGVWWFGWAIWTLRVVPEPPVRSPEGGLTAASAIGIAVRELAQTFRELRRFRVVLIYLAAFLLFNDGVQTVLAIAGAYAADTLGIPLAFNMTTIAIIQFVAVPGALAFGKLADRIATKPALIVSLLGWIVIVLFGVALAPLTPTTHEDFDFQLGYRDASGDYLVEAGPDLDDPFELRWQGEYWTLEAGAVLGAGAVANLPEAIEETEDVEYGVSIRGGALDGQSALGPAHPALLGGGPIDWWPSLVRGLLWEPLGLGVGYQWLLLGVLVGWIIGGSQALARSLYAQITPERRSAEFFSFFGFISRASSVFGPTLYIVATAVFDTRVAVTSILLIIVAGTIALRWVNVAEGARVAAEEDARTSSD